MFYEFHSNKPVLSRCLTAARHAVLAYSPVQHVDAMLHVRGGFDKALPAGAGDAEAYLALAPGYAVISVRGTDSSADWKANLDKKPIAWNLSAGHVHTGFLSASNAVAQRVVGLLNAHHVRSSTPLYITGHSQGGAIAALLSVILAQGGWHVAETITFASPRCMDGVAASHVDTCNLVRVVNEGDVIPFLPLHLFGSGYSHAGRLLHLGSRGQIDTEPNSLPARALLRLRGMAAAARVAVFGGAGVAAIQAVKAHSMGEHIRRLKLAGAK